MRIYGPNGTTLGSPAGQRPANQFDRLCAAGRRSIDPRKPRRDRAEGGGQHRCAAGHAGHRGSDRAPQALGAARQRGARRAGRPQDRPVVRQFRCLHREPAAGRRRQPQIHLRRPRPRCGACPRSSCGSKSNWPRPDSSERAVPAGAPAYFAHRFLRGNPRGCTVSGRPTILSVTGRRYIRRARTDPFPSALHVQMGWPWKS